MHDEMNWWIIAALVVLFLVLAMTFGSLLQWSI
jgi:hypothetical protein